MKTKKWCVDDENGRGSRMMDLQAIDVNSRPITAQAVAWV
jgi:hypothetical protein